jgi:hypothetical protein
MRTSKTSMQAALEAIDQIRGCAEMVEPIFPKLIPNLDIIESSVRNMGIELNVRDSYPVESDPPSETGNKIRRLAEEFEDIIHEKCQNLWALVGSVERGKCPSSDLAVAIGELMWPDQIIGTVMACQFGREQRSAWGLAKQVNDEAAEYYRRQYEEEEADRVQP